MTDQPKWIERTEAEWDALQDAIATVIGLQSKVGHTLTQDDVNALILVDKYQSEDEESAVDAYHQGLAEGRREVGGGRLVELHAVLDKLRVERLTERVMRKFAEQDRDALRALLTRAREYVTDALDAYEHSDGRDLLREIDAALSPTPGETPHD